MYCSFWFFLVNARYILFVILCIFIFYFFGNEFLLNTTITFILFQVFPVFFVLMDSKKTESYISVFKYIEENVFHLQPNQFITDWESGLRAALSTVYPNVPLKGCWYHYCSAVRRKARSLGMTDLLKSNTKAYLTYKRILCIPLLPADSIITGFSEIKATARKERLFGKFAELFKYFEDYWLNVNEKHSNSVFGIWMRTTSPLEAFNSVLNRSLPKHANFFKFLEGLKNHEFTKAVDMRNAINEPEPEVKRKRKRDQLREDRISKYSGLLKAKKIKIDEFFEEVAVKENFSASESEDEN